MRIDYEPIAAGARRNGYWVISPTRVGPFQNVDEVFGYIESRHVVIVEHVRERTRKAMQEAGEDVVFYPNDSCESTPKAMQRAES
jgi:hypothetical protein